MSYSALPDEQYDEPLASLSITHVSYDPTDPLSLVAAYLSLVPQGLMVVYAVLIFSHRELEIVLACVGQLGNEAVNYVLKRLIKEARPTSMYNIIISIFILHCLVRKAGFGHPYLLPSYLLGLLIYLTRTRFCRAKPLTWICVFANATLDLKGKGYGMPSSHTQFMFFFATYISLWIAVRNHAIPITVKPLLLLALPILATGIAAARVYLHYHTPRQVMVGAGAGVAIGIGWFVATALMKNLAGGVIWDLLLENPLSKALYVKDECVEVDLQQRDWEMWWTARVQRKQEAEKKKQR
ncbi:Dolichyldiphosphatase [Drechslerella dactyloides]|uniref:Dolichyldiphosphatase n=1 Tax=Drechslerella dactyloides TaxID=74499 RepID=A0AAD6NK55_DREDA|nr:Dolichyldiphosphatase [Drechslerella dactyloides]